VAPKPLWWPAAGFFSFSRLLAILFLVKNRGLKRYSIGLCNNHTWWDLNGGKKIILKIQQLNFDKFILMCSFGKKVTLFYVIYLTNMCKYSASGCRHLPWPADSPQAMMIESANCSKPTPEPMADSKSRLLTAFILGSI
jgi:hypothetical protein